MSPSDASPRSLADQTLRMIVTPHLGGGSLRVHLSNRFGSAPVTLGRVSIGLRGAGAAVVAGTSRAVTFAGQTPVTIAPGAEVVSDPTGVRFRAFEQLAISVYIAGTIPSPTEHSTTRQTNYLSPAGSGDRAADDSASAFSQTTTSISSSGWFFLDGIDVVAPAGTGAVVAFGDSITDGFQGNITPVTEQLSTIDMDTRYPDALARRLIGAKVPLSVLNAGISGNRVLQDGQSPSFGPKGLARFPADALARSGVTDVIVLEGINDIGQTNGITAQDLIDAYPRLIAQAHAAGLRIQLGTLTPAGGTLVPTYGGASAEQIRQQVNTWIRAQHLADGVVDFDAAVRDPQKPGQLAASYDGSDHLHFSPAGYQALANAVNLDKLARPACLGGFLVKGPGGAEQLRKGCVSRRAFTVHLPARYARRLMRGRVLLDGRRIAKLSPHHTKARINLRGLGRRTVQVRIGITLRSGRHLASARTFHTCRPRP